MPTLPNQVQEDFARAIASRVKAVDAYAAGHPNASRKTCAEQGSKMAKIPKVATRILELRALAEKAAVSQDEKAVEHAAKKLAGTLLTMTDRRRILSGFANDTKLKAETRMTALMHDAKLAGELIDRQDLTSDGEALPTVMPTIQMNLPASFVARRAGRN